MEPKLALVYNVQAGNDMLGAAHGVVNTGDGYSTLDVVESLQEVQATRDSEP
jgi:hypothetical protein